MNCESIYQSWNIRPRKQQLCFWDITPSQRNYTRLWLQRVLDKSCNYTVQYSRYLTGCVLTVLTQSWLGLCWFHCPQYLLYLNMIPGLAYRNNCSADSVQKHWFITSSVILSESAMHDEKKGKKKKNRARGQFSSNFNIRLSLVNPKSLQYFPNPTRGVNPFVEDS